MKRLNLFLLNVSIFALMPMMAGAVGTYYNGNMYKNPQQNYGTGTGGYYNTYGAGRGYGQYANQSTMVRTTTTKTTKKSSKSSAKDDGSQKSGFKLGVDLSHEFGNWKFNMKNAGSRLHYDNLEWNVISGEGAYYFGDSTKMQIKLGARYGKQFDESTMVDDDITSGGYPQGIEGVTGHGISIGTSKDGAQMGFHAAFGFTDLFKVGRLKMTPSIGYRYFKHELETKSNYAMVMDTLNAGNSGLITCVQNGSEKQCDPVFMFSFYQMIDGTPHILKDANGDDVFFGSRDMDEEGGTTAAYTGILSGTDLIVIDLGDTYYVEQAGTSHKYETEWAGPYLALDMEYAMNEYNFFNGGIEFGLPMYTSKGDQPYRNDWAHPTSVEDKGGFGDAYHLGLNATWTTMVSEMVGLSLGMTYDYYRVDGADAKTYLNPAFYDWALSNGYYSQEEYDYAANSGWVLKHDGEIESIYKSMGVHLGVNVKF